MQTEEQILTQLDNYKSGDYCHFIDLGNVYSYLIDSRLNIFRGKDNWAIAAERLGFNPRSGGIMLDIYYFGNCLTNLESYNGQNSNYYTVLPIEWSNFIDTVRGEVLNADAKYWIIRGQQIELCQNKEDYLKAGIKLKEYQPGEISVEEVGRLLITTHQDLLRATDEELYKSIPKDLQKILVIDKWYHLDFSEIDHTVMSNEQILKTYEFNKNLVTGEYPLDYQSFVDMFRKQEQERGIFNQDQYQNKRPSSYETWNLIAQVISTGNTSFYKPKLEPNNHWVNWPDSGGF